MKMMRAVPVGLVLALAALMAVPAGAGQDKAETPEMPATFDLRDLDGVTPVKQQLGGTCWTHGAMASIESHLILSGYWKGAGRGGLPALSEYHLDWWNGFNKHCNEDVADVTKDPNGLRPHFGGDYRVTTAYLSRGDGVVLLPPNHDVFRDSDWYQKAPPRDDPAYQRLYVRDVEWFVLTDDLSNIDKLKRRIMTEGALGTCYTAGRTYLGKDNVQYQPKDTRGDPNHAVAIIGWDDAKISTDPAHKAPKPGAWLIKNSWGTRRGEQGYYWISYYDKHCCRHPEMGAVSFRNIEPLVYTNVYSHDYHGWRDTLPKVSHAFNAFTATGRQFVRAVSFYTTRDDVKYTVKVHARFADGKLGAERSAKSGTIAVTGFHTINLDTPMLVNKDDRFYVSVELSDGGHAIDRTSQIPVLLGQQPQPQPQPGQPAQPQPPRRGPTPPPWVTSKAGPGESFYLDGNTWKDLQDYRFPEAKFDKTANFCIKALAVSVEESPYKLAPSILASVPARNIGPANMGGRICDLTGVEDKPDLAYAATATGGVWKTTDGGKSWASLFDQQSTPSAGAVAVAPSNPDIVWVGSGEANPRNSVSWGDGIYKSTDAGKTWTNMGLKETRHIGRVVIHPKNPDIVYVAALGHVWGPNRDRGVFKTADGGKTWQKVKFIDENTGFIDVAMDPSEPDTLYAAAWPVRRDGFSAGNPKTGFGTTGGLFKTTDAGKTWAKMTEGLPAGAYGRCGISVYRKDPNIVYAVIQTDKTPTTVAGAPPKAGNDVTTGGVFRSADKGKTWTKLNDLCPRPFYYGQIRVDPSDDKRVYVLGVRFFFSDDGGKTFVEARKDGVHGDHHALWIDPKDSNRAMLGNDGGIYLTKDRTKTWSHVRSMPLAQFYAIAVDNAKPYRVYGGLQDNGNWSGPSATDRADGITLADWKRHTGDDGFQWAIDPADPNTAYAETQYGRPVRLDLKAGTSRAIKPVAPEGKPAYRFNWNSPMLLSVHEPKTLYYGGNHVFKSTDRGDRWEAISPDLTRGQPGPSANYGHTLTTIAESPLKAGVLYAGTDDGRLHVSRDSGKSWMDLSDKIPGLPPERSVSRIECSPFAEGTAFVAIDRHRNDDLRPYLYKTMDFGATWTRLANNLPDDAPVHVVRQSSRNADLLFVGTENGLYGSLDGGRRWFAMKNGLPGAVPVHDLVIHPRDRELVVATHGRGIHILDIAPLEEMTTKVLTADAHLFEVKPAAGFTPRPTAEAAARPAYKGTNPPYGVSISYFLRGKMLEPATVTVADLSGKPLATLTGEKTAGLHRLVWDLRVGDSQAQVPAGEYTVTLKAGGKTLTKKVRVERLDKAE